MKKIFLIILLGFITFSCNENFSPFGEFKEKYIINCILRGDSTFQIAALSKSYNPENFNPDLITQDVSISNADIRILMNDSVYIFKDSVTNRIDTSRYKTLFHFYFNNKFEIIPNKDIEIDIVLPSGRRFHSFTKSAAKIQFDQRSSDNISESSSNLLQFIWNYSFSGQYFYPKMLIIYSKNENGSSKIMAKEVPVRYSSDGGSETPVYSQITTQTNLNIEKQAITKALSEISKGDPNKQNYTIYEFARVSVLAFDQNLSRYYSTTNGSLDDLTVRIDENDYTNIEGGYGIFASYVKGEYKIKFFPSYIQSFGYNLLIEN